MSDRHTFRSFWQSNSRAPSPSARHQDVLQLERLVQKLDSAEKKIDEFLRHQDVSQVEILTQKLDAAEKKIDEYSRLSEFSSFSQVFSIEYLTVASLYAELKRHQDAVCYHCRENVVGATLATPLITPALRTQPASQPIPAASTIMSESPNVTTSNLGQPPPPIVQETAELSLPMTSAMDAHVPTKFTPILSPYSTDAADSDSSRQIVPIISETAVDADDTEPKLNLPDWSVEYNPNIKQTLRLHVADTLTFTTRVLSAKFSHDGKSLAMGLLNGETHIYDTVTKSIRYNFLCPLSS